MVERIHAVFLAPKATRLFLPGADADVFGGAEVQLFLLSRALAQRDMAVSCLLRCPKDLAVESLPLTADGVNLIWCAPCPHIRSIPGIRLVDAWRVTWRDLDRSAECFPNHSRIIIQRCGGILTVQAGWYCRVRSVPFVFQLASTKDSNGTVERQLGSIYGAMYRAAIRRANLLVAQTIDQQKQIRRRFGRDADLIRSIQTIPAQTENPRRGILWVGRSDRIKRPDLALDLAAALPDVPFILVCPRAENTSPEVYDQLRRRAAELTNIKWIEGLSFDDADRLYPKVEILVNTSEQEGYPNTFIQATRVATPVVSFRVDPDGLLHAYGAGFCSQGDWNAFVNSCRSLLNNRRQWQDMSEHAYRMARAIHDAEATAERYVHRFRQLIEKRAKT